MTTNKLSKQYNPNDIEPALLDTWQTAGLAAPSYNHDQASFCLMLPPPNVTGTLHMGHGFQQTLMDILTRYHRMKAHNTLWQGGTDHAGIATQMIVERQLATQGINKHDIGREAFLDKTWEWKEKSAGRITEQIKQLGASIDWSRDRFTMDEDLQTATKTAFCKLYDDGLIYRGKRLVNWDPILQTAISNLEVLNVEKKGSLWHIKYPLADKPAKHIVVATTRPETLFGDVCVAVHPNDERYQHLIGQQLKLPLTDRTIPIVADNYVDPEFGSGCVKITPAHDFNDYAVGKRHQFTPINILNDDATLNTNVPEKYQDIDRIKVRQTVIDDLQQAGLLDHIDDHTLQVPTGDRSGAVIEPYLTDQWFIKTESLAKPALEAITDQSLQFVPEGWTKTYTQWLDNIEDWCISRQLWWGHRVPAFYDEEGNIYVGMDENDVRQKYQLNENIKLTQDDDVLDTWFTSALWPFATLGWPKQTPELDIFYPTQVLVTGFDLIFFWIARMVMFGLYFMGKVPFEKVYIHGLIRDSKGQKMSKSKGNVLDPLDLIHGISLDNLIEKRTATLMQPHMKDSITKQTKKEFPNGIEAYGTDALRFTFCALANTSRNINFDLGRIEGYRNFCNKLYNAARFALQNIPERTHFAAKPEIINTIDQWILLELNKTIVEAEKHIANYRFDLLAACLYEFVWNVYCDWYLELAKSVLYNDKATNAQLQSTQYTLLYVLDMICRLLHPIMPFITETIWEDIKPLLNLDDAFLAQASYPRVIKNDFNDTINEDISWLQNLITECRAMRSKLNISPSKTMSVKVLNATDSDQQRLQKFKDSIATLAKIDHIEYITTEEGLPLSASCYIDPMTIFVPLAGLIDMDAEIARHTKQKEKIMAEISKIEKKLANENYVAKAPAAVVEKTKAELAVYQNQLQQIIKHLASLNEA